MKRPAAGIVASWLVVCGACAVAAGRAPATPAAPAPVERPAERTPRPPGASVNAVPPAGPAETAPLASVAQKASIARFSQTSGPQPPEPWRVVTLPRQTRHTTYAVVDLDGERVLRIEADASYANLLHEFVPSAGGQTLRWRWRVDRLIDQADLTTRAGDDAPARVCVLFDVPPERLSWGTRALLALWRAVFDPRLPASTVCYVWDATLAAGTWLPNAYTDRVRMLVLQRGDTGRWFEETRDLAADFAAAFPREAQGGLPPIAAVGVAADADNTQQKALTYVGDIELR